MAPSPIIITRDWFGNQQTESSGWTLNTTMVLTTFSLDTSHPDVNVSETMLVTLSDLSQRRLLGALLMWMLSMNHKLEVLAVSNRTTSTTQTWTYDQQENYTSWTTLDQHHNNGCIRTNGGRCLHVHHR